MLKSELIAILAKENPQLPPEDMHRLVEVIFDEIQKALSAGKRVELRGFGAFSVRYRKAKVGRNPKTGKPVAVPAKQVPFFRPGKELRKRINGGWDPESGQP